MKVKPPKLDTQAHPEAQPACSEERRFSA